MSFLNDLKLLASCMENVVQYNAKKSPILWEWSEQFVTQFSLWKCFISISMWLTFENCSPLRIEPIDKTMIFIFSIGRYFWQFKNSEVSYISRRSNWATSKSIAGGDIFEYWFSIIISHLISRQFFIYW